METDIVIDANGRNRRVVKIMGAGAYNFSITFEEHINISDDNMKFSEEMVEMYVGDDVSPNFYDWVLQKHNQFRVGTVTIVNRPAIRQYQKVIYGHAGEKIAKSKIIKVEVHPIPEHYRSQCVQGCLFLVGDAARYVTKSFGRGTYCAAKFRHMVVQDIVSLMNNGRYLPNQEKIEDTYVAKYNKAYTPTYTVLG